MMRPHTKTVLDIDGNAIPLPSEHRGGYAYALEMSGVLITPDGEREVPKTVYWTRDGNDYRDSKAEALLAAAPIGAVYEAMWNEEWSGDEIVQQYHRRVYRRTDRGWELVEYE